MKSNESVPLPPPPAVKQRPHLKMCDGSRSASPDLQVDDTRGSRVQCCNLHETVDAIRNAFRKLISKTTVNAIHKNAGQCKLQTTLTVCSVQLTDRHIILAVTLHLQLPKQCL